MDEELKKIMDAYLALADINDSRNDEYMKMVKRKIDEMRKSVRDAREQQFSYMNKREEQRAAEKENRIRAYEIGRKERHEHLIHLANDFLLINALHQSGTLECNSSDLEKVFAELTQIAMAERSGREYIPEDYEVSIRMTITKKHRPI